MALFQESVLKQQLSNLNDDLLVPGWEYYSSYFLVQSKQEDILSKKESEYQTIFLQELFGKCLGYTLDSANTFEQNLFREYKNQTDSKQADGAIKIEGEVVCVIELKSSKTKELSKIEDQAFGYLTAHPNCKYVVISNFRKLRFYIQNKTEFEEFDLFNLSEERFRMLWLCLSFRSISSNLPLELKNRSLVNEEKITKQLYSDYSSFRQELFNDIVKHNPNYEKSLILNKTQKLLDRILFILFAEDRRLLPTNTISEIISNWENDNARGRAESLYSNFIEYFNLINIGRPKRGDYEEIFSYNGGLFYEDIELDSLIISNDILLDYVKKLTSYDFESDISVNILGHIFEHSLSEIEELQNQIEGKVLDKSKSKRKKDGVFYTPQYITKYIVENTVGKLCEEKKNELNIIEEEYLKGRKGRPKNKLESLRDILEDYRKWLLELTICDPACGSGAFLNQALEFLISEHKYIDELRTSLLDESIQFYDIENSILENNLFGVDINRESIEIAKLSLWLRTAKKGRKLTSLNNNIKCGNSLIDEPAVAGEKAFNWQKEFPQVFEKGGFDVVIGNPPYVSLEKIKKSSNQLEKIGFKTYDKRGDLYILFVEQGFRILKKDSLISYIIPNKWLQSGYGKALREYFLSYELITLIDFGDIQIFEGATTYPCIFVSRKGQPKSEFTVSALKSIDNFDFNNSILKASEKFKTSEFSGDTWIISSKVEKELLSKLKHNKSLEEFIEGGAHYGIKFGLTEAFLIDEIKKQKIISEDLNANNLIGSILRGRDLKRYGTPNKSDLDYIILAGFNSYKFIESKYPSIYNHLIQYEEKLKMRGQCNGSLQTNDKPYMGQHHWLELDNNPSELYLSLYKKPKIMYQTFQVKPCFIFDDTGLYCNNSMWIIPTNNKSLLGILNSKMGWWLISKYCTQIQNGCQLIWKYFKQIPIPDLSNSELENSVDLIISLNSELQEISSRLIRAIKRDFKIQTLPKKLQNWYSGTFNEFIIELSKKKVKLSKSEELDWEDVFIKESEKVLEIKNSIDKTDKEIDQTVYELYGLTKEEIEIVENS